MCTTAGWAQVLALYGHAGDSSQSSSANILQTTTKLPNSTHTHTHTHTHTQSKKIKPKKATCWWQRQANCDKLAPVLATVANLTDTDLEQNKVQRKGNAHCFSNG